MTNLIPGFIWIPVDVGQRAARIKGRGLVGHVAVSSSTDLRPGPLATRPADWHAYLPKVGPGIQYIDLDVQCWASAGGNPSLAAFESQGGLGTAAEVNAEPWTADQCEAAAIFLAHLHTTEGVPLQVMPNSLAASRGFGPHRLGIDPWRVAGGESWSSSAGKLCPGDAKIAQIPAIVARATQIVGGTPKPVPAPAIPARLAWNLPVGHYYGNIAGPNQSHGGINAAEREFVLNIQQWLIFHGCVPGVPSAAWAHSGWADGKWQAPTDTAMAAWHARFYPGQPKPTQCWADDYARLARR